MKTKTTFGIAMIAALFATVPTENAFAEKAVVDEIASSFKRADFIHNAEGTAKVITYDDWSQKLQFGSNFKSTPGPDIYVYLATDDKASDFVSLGKIQNNDGAQEYAIPVGTDLNKYDKVLIWCQAFGVLFGTADLPEYTASPQSKSSSDDESNNSVHEITLEEKENNTMEKSSDVQKPQAISNDMIFLKGELTSPAGNDPNDDPFGGEEIVGDYYVRIRDGEQVRVFANLNPAPEGTVLEGWLVDFESGYTLSTGKANDKDVMIFTQRMVNPSIYDALVITAEPIRDDDPAPAALHIGGTPIGELFK
ncbi:MAG: DM13 domain-containing protein [Nitrosopumilus sp.]